MMQRLVLPRFNRRAAARARAAISQDVAVAKILSDGLAELRTAMRTSIPSYYTKYHGGELSSALSVRREAGAFYYTLRVTVFRGSRVVAWRDETWEGVK